MSIEVQDYRLNVDDNNCLLVEFLNDNNSLSLAFRCWLKDEELRENDKMLKSAIINKKETILCWPSVKLNPAKKMKKQLGKMPSWANDEAVRVLNIGGKYFNN